MAIFNGRYTWDGTRQDNRDPIAWSPGAYDVKIIDRSSQSHDRVRQLKPYICIYSATGKGQSISANPEKFALRICDDFSLEFHRVIWVEDLLTEKDRYEIISFVRTRSVGNRIFYRTEKRKPGARELQMIKDVLAGLGEP